MLNVADRIASMFADDRGNKPRVVVDPNGSPRYDAVNRTIYLPALPADNLSAEEQRRLRAYFWHEMQGEAFENTWSHDPRRMSHPAVARLANGIGDAYLDNTIVEKRPGSGLDIRTEVRRDFENLAKESQSNALTPTVGVAAALSRYIGERVTSWNEVRTTMQLTDPLFFDYVERVIPDDYQPKAATVIDDALRLWAELQQYHEDATQRESEQPEAEPQDGGSKSDSEADDDANEDDDADSEADGNGNEDDDTDSEADDDGNGDSDSDDDTEGDDSGDSGDSGDSEADPDGEGSADGDDDDTEGEGQGQGQGQGDADGETVDEPYDQELGPTDKPKSEQSKTGSGVGRDAPKEKTTNTTPSMDDFVEGGETSDERIAKDVKDTLTGSGEAGETPRLTFDDSMAGVVTPDMYPSELTALLTDSDKRLGTALANMLRAALTGPTIREDRFQEYGRLDSRRLSAALSGSKMVYQRRRELPSESVAVTVAADVSGSMGTIGQAGSGADMVRRLAGAFFAAQRSVPKVRIEVGAWDTTDPHEFAGFAKKNPLPEGHDDSLSGEFGFMARYLEGQGFSVDREDFYNTRQMFRDEVNKRPYSERDALYKRMAADEVGRSKCTYRVIKTHDEEATPTVVDRLRHLNGGGGTPTMTALRLAMQRLAQRDERRKVLFFLTDGDASADEWNSTLFGYNPIGKLIEEGAAAGIDVVVVHISDYNKTATDVRDIVRLTFGKTPRYIPVSSKYADEAVATMTKHLLKVLTKHQRNAAA